MFLFQIQPAAPSPPPHGDSLVQNMANATANQGRKFTELLKIAGAENTHKKLPPNPTILSVLFNTLASNAMHAQKLILDTAIKLHKNGEIALTQRQEETIVTGRQQPSRPQLECLTRWLANIIPPERTNEFRTNVKKGLSELVAEQKRRKQNLEGGNVAGLRDLA